MLSEAPLGDVIRAWRALGATTDEERQLIAQQLGFALRDVAATHGPAPEPTAPRVPEKVPRPRPRAETTRPSENAPGVRVSLLPLPDVHDTPIALPAAALPRPAATRTTRARSSLFREGWARAILGTMATRMSESGRIDVDRVVDRIAQARPIQVLPRRRRLVSAPEVVVVIDGRGTMSWFGHDAVALGNRLDAVSRAPVSITLLRGAPILVEGSARSEASGDSDELVEGAGCDRIRIGPGGRVIAISDIGLGSPWAAGNPGRARGWATFAATLRARGGSLVLVTPIPLGRIPMQLRRIAACVWWDAATRPAGVHRTVAGLR